MLWAFSNITGALQEIPIIEIHQSILNNSLTWIHVQSDDQVTRDSLARLGIDDYLIDALCEKETRPRVISFNKAQVLYLRGINKNHQAKPEDMVSLRVCLQDKLIITARQKDRGLQSTLALKSQIENGLEIRSPAHLLSLLIEKITNIISEAVDELNEQVSALEEDLELTSSDRMQLNDIRRQTAMIRRHISPQREALDAFYRHNQALPSDLLQQIRDDADRMTRYVEELDLVKERTILQQEELRNRVAEKQGNRLYFLSLVTAIFLPLSFLTGVFGMNVAGLPGTERPDAFMYLILAMVALAIALAIYMKMSKWF